MTHWKVRETLSSEGRLRRSYYEILRDQLDQMMLQYALIDSYDNFRSAKVAYPFVEKRELKPRARIPDKEYDRQNTFLVLFVEGTIPPVHKKYIRFFDVNKTTKSNLLTSKSLPLSSRFDRHQKVLESAHFASFLKAMLPVDYALLIQRDATTKARNRYTLSHFHVRIDWPITDAAEDLARDLRYISKDIFEKGDKYAEDLQKKFFEYYGQPVMVGGRRTAAIVAAQFLKRLPCITTVYVGSSETRALIRISERGVSKAALMPFRPGELTELAERNGISPATLRKHYLVAGDGRQAICIFQATYRATDPARTPDDGRLREFKADLNWLTVGSQHVLPKPGVWKYPPLACNVIYT